MNQTKPNPALTAQDASQPLNTPAIAVFRMVGILGGMGPAATVDLMQKIIAATPAKCDQEHVPMIVWNVPQIPDRNLFLNGSGPSPAEAMRNAACSLALAGAEAIAIACNTAHLWADEIAQAANLPVIHIVDAALAEVLLERQYTQQTAQTSSPNIMLLSTDATQSFGVYAKRAEQRHITLLSPRLADQRVITDVISLVKAGQTGKARALLLPVLRTQLEQGVDRFLLGCTEMPLVVAGSEFEAKSIDATLALARAIVRFSTGVSTKMAYPRRNLSNNNERNNAFGDQVA